jgi:hypothetical protein
LAALPDDTVADAKCRAGILLNDVRFERSQKSPREFTLLIHLQAIIAG